MHLNFLLVQVFSGVLSIALLLKGLLQKLSNENNLETGTFEIFSKLMSSFRLTLLFQCSLMLI